MPPAKPQTGKKPPMLLKKGGVVPEKKGFTGSGNSTRSLSS
jgi:hypothetical protein